MKIKINKVKPFNKWGITELILRILIGQRMIVDRFFKVWLNYNQMKVVSNNWHFFILSFDFAALVLLFTQIMFSRFEFNRREFYILTILSCWSFSHVDLNVKWWLVILCLFNNYEFFKYFDLLLLTSHFFKNKQKDLKTCNLILVAILRTIVAYI